MHKDEHKSELKNHNINLNLTDELWGVYFED